MSDAPPVITPPPLPADKNRYQEMARASWLAPLIAFVMNYAIKASQGGKIGPATMVTIILSPLFILGGLVFGIIALFGIRKNGKRRILVPALLGIGANLFLIVAIALPILLYQISRDYLRPAVHTPSAYLLKNDKLRFSMDIPGAFRDYPEGKQSPTAEHVYIKAAPGGGEVPVVITIERLNRLVRKTKPLTREAMPSGFKGELTTRSWRGVKIEARVQYVETNGFRIRVYAMLIPLKPSAILLSVGGPESMHDDISQLADTLLSSLEGERNW